jgi:hypothetical protein
MSFHEVAGCRQKVLLSAVLVSLLRRRNNGYKGRMGHNGDIGAFFLYQQLQQNTRDAYLEDHNRKLFYCKEKNTISGIF